MPMDLLSPELGDVHRETGPPFEPQLSSRTLNGLLTMGTRPLQAPLSGQLSKMISVM